jgi:hypothetical protein
VFSTLEKQQKKTNTPENTATGAGFFGLDLI